VNCSTTTLAILAALSASLALAEDFKTIDGREYKNAAVTRVEADGLVLKTNMGISKVYFTELPKDVQKRFLPSPPKISAAQRGLIALKSRAAAMANPASFVLLLVAGVSLIAATVFAVLRLFIKSFGARKTERQHAISPRERRRRSRMP
jgi:hypothetical protein